MKSIKDRLRNQRDAEISEELVSDPFSNDPHSFIHKKRSKELDNKRKKLKITNIGRE